MSHPKNRRARNIPYPFYTRWIYYIIVFILIAPTAIVITIEEVWYDSDAISAGVGLIAMIIISSYIVGITLHYTIVSTKEQYREFFIIFISFVAVAPIIIAVGFIIISVLGRFRVWLESGYWIAKPLFYEIGIDVEPTHRVGLDKIINFIANIPVEFGISAAVALYIIIINSWLSSR